MGFSLEAAKRLASIPIPVTWAIIPYQRFSQATARIAGDHGIPFLVHMPMEAKGYPGDPKALVRAGMDPGAVRAAVRNALWSLPGAAGLNNHQGSRATEDPRAMGGVMLELKAEGLFFVDSRTSGGSVAYNGPGEGVRPRGIAFSLTIMMMRVSSGNSSAKPFPGPESTGGPWRYATPGRGPWIFSRSCGK